MPNAAVALAVFRPLLQAAGVCLALLSFSTTAQAPMDVRVALVIGNAAYSHVPALSNSANDARSMALVLRKLGFKVLEVIDGDRTSMVQAMQRMQTDLSGTQAVAMLYYAGHGLQLDWRNYMVPVDAKIERAQDIPKQTVDIEQVIQTFKRAGTRMNILVLDACRDNPFGSTASGKGLAQLDAPPGTYLAYATAPGNVAEDGDETSGNGLFTQFLLKELQRPAKIEDVFKRVRLQVRQKSQGRQIPWDSSSLEDDFAFNDGQKFRLTADDYQAAVQEAKQKEERLRREALLAAEREQQLAKLQEQERLKQAEAQRISEQKARERAQAEARQREQQLALAAEAERKRALEAQQAIERLRAEETQRLKDLELSRVQAQETAARQKLSEQEARERQFAEEKTEWDRIKDSKNPQDFYAFLLKFPNGLISQQATFSLERLEKSKVQAQPDQSGQVQKAGESRFRLNDEFTRITKDDYTGRIIKTATYRIYKIENERAYAKSETEEIIATLDGASVQAVTSSGTLTYDPPFTNMPGDELAVGKRWISVSTGQNRYGNFYRNVDIKITARENITIQAGTFLAYRFELKGWAGSTRIEETYWHIPEFGVRLKSITKLYPQRGAATLESNELTQFKLGTAVN